MAPLGSCLSVATGLLPLNGSACELPVMPSIGVGEMHSFLTSMSTGFGEQNWLLSC